MGDGAERERCRQHPKHVWKLIKWIDKNFSQQRFQRNYKKASINVHGGEKNWWANEPIKQPRPGHNEFCVVYLLRLAAPFVPTEISKLHNLLTSVWKNETLIGNYVFRPSKNKLWKLLFLRTTKRCFFYKNVRNRDYPIVHKGKFSLSWWIWQCKMSFRCMYKKKSWQLDKNLRFIRLISGWKRLKKCSLPKLEQSPEVHHQREQSWCQEEGSWNTQPEAVVMSAWECKRVALYNATSNN